MIKVRRRAEVSWQGTVEDGGGHIALGSGAFEGPYSLEARVADSPQTNPEELVGAGHAACFTMSLANLLGEAGHPATDLRTKAKVHLDQQETGFSITRIELSCVGDVPGVDDERFAALAAEAERTCPVSRALAGTEIVVDAKLAG